MPSCLAWAAFLSTCSLLFILQKFKNSNLPSALALSIFSFLITQSGPHERSAFSLAHDFTHTYLLSPFPSQGQEDCHASHEASWYVTHGTSLPRFVAFQKSLFQQPPLSNEIIYENPIERGFSNSSTDGGS